MRSVDFVVVGGGPAGCAFAILAARAGASVILVERDDYEKRRPGEHLAGRIRGRLDELRVPTDGARAISVGSPGILSLWNGAAPLVKPHAASGQRDALCVTRHRFDELLFRTATDAGASTLSCSTLARIARRRGGWHLTITDAHGRSHAIHARSVVDASGRNAVFARSQGARRAHHGDLIAIVGWLDAGAIATRASAILTVESCPVGWWSLSGSADGTLVATLYTSSRMIKTVGVTHELWWAHTLERSRSVARTLRQADATLTQTAVYPAFPSRLSQLVGDGWIAVGDAAVTFDPIAGQGVAMAIETAFRAFEAATVDPTWCRLGPAYQDALTDQFDRHMKGRVRVYDEAAGVLGESFVRGAVRSTQQAKG